MSAIVVIIPIIIIRYALLNILSKESLPRAAFFAPLVGSERAAYWIYQATTLLILVDLIFLKIRFDSDWFYTGAGTYSIGLVFYALSMVDFARPKTNGINVDGLYRISRNPMYVAYFICLFGCVLISTSWTLFSLLLIFQISSHWIIRSEERWCIEKFGEEYVSYMKKVRRYI